jgi:non-ribosomal peptide synthetase component F
VAILGKQGAWSYGELESRSNQLANCLISSGIYPGDIVAIYADRSASLVWALLGILKAGAAFLILEPAYPVARLINYVRVAKPRAWIALEGAGTPPKDLEAFISTIPSHCRFALPESKTAMERHPLREYRDSNPSLPGGPEDLAYIACTSGTTGKPNAIQGIHGPLSHFLKWHCETFNLKETDRFSMLSGLSHDPLLRDIFTPLWLGAMLCIPDPGYVSGPLADWIKQYKITIAHLTPANQLLIPSRRGR